MGGVVGVDECVFIWQLFESVVEIVFGWKGKCFEDVEYSLCEVVGVKVFFECVLCLFDLVVVDCLVEEWCCFFVDQLFLGDYDGGFVEVRSQLMLIKLFSYSCCGVGIRKEVCDEFFWWVCVEDDVFEQFFWFLCCIFCDF